MQGNRVTDDSTASKQTVAQEAQEISQTEREENVRQLISDCKKLLIDVNNEDCFGSWGLINYTDQYDPSQLDPDVFLLFTSNSLYISNYDDANETLVDYQKILLKDVEKLELAPEFNRFSKSNSQPKFYVLRLYYRMPNESDDTADTSGYFHTFRSSNLRFFNNLVITTNDSDQLTESLRGICHTIQSTALHFNCEIIFEETNKLVKKKSKQAQNFIRLSRFGTRLSIDFDLRKSDAAAAAAVALPRNMSIAKKLNKFFSSEQNGSDSFASSDSVQTFGESKLGNQNNSYAPKMSLVNFLNSKDKKLKFIYKYIINESRTKFILM